MCRACCSAVFPGSRGIRRGFPDQDNQSENANGTVGQSLNKLIPAGIDRLPLKVYYAAKDELYVDRQATTFLFGIVVAPVYFFSRLFTLHWWSQIPRSV